MNSIGQFNIEIVEAITLAHMEHGSTGDALHEGIILDIPKRIFAMYDLAYKEVEFIVKDTIDRNKR